MVTTRILLSLITCLLTSSTADTCFKSIFERIDCPTGCCEDVAGHGEMCCEKYKPKGSIKPTIILSACIIIIALVISVIVYCCYQYKRSSNRKSYRHYHYRPTEIRAPQTTPRVPPSFSSHSGQTDGADPLLPPPYEIAVQTTERTTPAQPHSTTSPTDVIASPSADPNTSSPSYPTAPPPPIYPPPLCQTQSSLSYPRETPSDYSTAPSLSESVLRISSPPANSSLPYPLLPSSHSSVPPQQNTSSQGEVLHQHLTAQSTIDAKHTPTIDPASSPPSVPKRVQLLDSAKASVPNLASASALYPTIPQQKCHTDSKSSSPSVQAGSPTPDAVLQQHSGTTALVSPTDSSPLSESQ